MGPIFAWNVPLVSLIFLKGSLVFPILFFSSISLYWLLRKAFFPSSLFFGTLHSNGYIFPFLLYLSLLFFSQLFVRLPQTIILPFAFLFLGDGLDPCLLYNVIYGITPFIKNSRKFKLIYRNRISSCQRLGVEGRAYYKEEWGPFWD